MRADRETRPAMSHAPLRTLPASSKKPTRAPTVVVVDDLRDLAEVTAMLLEADGYQVHCAEDGLSGLRLALESRADLVLLDHRMPHMTGGEVGKALRAHPETRDTKIVMVSATPEPIVRRAFDDYDEFIVKPYRPAGLLRTVRSLLDETAVAVHSA
jgi:two-component system phosphate regulon response regulator PhoB